MEFWTSVKILRRRWYVVVGGLIVLAIAAALVVKTVKPTYQAFGTIALVNTPPLPTTGGTPARNTTTTTALPNPWGPPNTFTQILVQAAGGDSFTKAVADGGGTGTFSMLPAANNLNTLTLTVTDATPARTLHSYDVVFAQLEKLALTKQREVNAQPLALYSLQPVTTPHSTIQLVGSRIKALIALSALIILLTLALAFLVDARRNRRERNDSLSLDEVALLQIAGPIASVKPALGPSADPRADPDHRDEAAGS